MKITHYPYIPPTRKSGGIAEGSKALGNGCYHNITSNYIPWDYKELIETVADSRPFLNSIDRDEMNEQQVKTLLKEQKIKFKK